MVPDESLRNSLTDTTILDTLREIQRSVANLESNYEAIQTIIKKEHEEIQAKYKGAPKSYAAAVSNKTIEENAAEPRARQQKQREITRQEKAKVGCCQGLICREGAALLPMFLARPSKALVMCQRNLVNKPEMLEDTWGFSCEFLKDS